MRTRSRTQVSGTLQRIASCLQSMNSYCATNTPLFPVGALFALDTVMVHHPSDSAQNRLLINHEIPTINDYLRCNTCGDSNALSTPPTRVSEQSPAASAKWASCQIAQVDQGTTSPRSEDAERHGLLRKGQYSPLPRRPRQTDVGSTRIWSAEQNCRWCVDNYKQIGRAIALQKGSQILSAFRVLKRQVDDSETMRQLAATGQDRATGDRLRKLVVKH